MSHNPYVGIQRTVFEQGWQRGLKALEKRLMDDYLKPSDVPEVIKIGVRDALREIEALRSD